MGWLGGCASSCCAGSTSLLEDERFYSKFVEDSHDNRDAGTADACPALQDWHSPDAPQLTSLQVLGRGTYARVLLVERGGTGKLYAMKTVQHDESVDPTQVQHTMTERRVLSRMRHPFIIRLHWAISTSTTLSLVLDYCPGGDLYFHLRKEGTFAHESVRLYAAEVLLAIQALHALDIAFRDLKPENILVSASGHVLLSDFGLAREAITSIEGGARTVCGTPTYMAPEVLQGTGHGIAVDYWGLGTLIFEMTTGSTPFYSRDLAAMYHAILHNAPRFPPNLHVPRATRSLALALLTRDPRRRAGSPSAGGAAGVRRFRFFRSLDWGRVLRKGYAPPFVPALDAPTDTRYFDETFTSERVDVADAEAAVQAAGEIARAPEGAR